MQRCQVPHMFAQRRDAEADDPILSFSDPEALGIVRQRMFPER